MKLPLENIVFIDTEFSSLNPYKGEILSIGLLKQDGSELYLELEYEGDYDDWVKENLLHTLTGNKVDRQQAADMIINFVGNGKPYMVAFVNQFDTLYLHKLLGGVQNSPFYWIPIDFASILFAYGYNPELYHKLDAKFFNKLNINPKKYKQHNALDDARLLKDTYLAMASDGY
ncbi:MAG: hypothetical protein MUF85_02070 [Patescibacteria group bacterium]|jgi:DNA polymerase III epsilon subunit-like protein|nr:hypothetical protein [Patescibacteria group bacterium]